MEKPITLKDYPREVYLFRWRLYGACLCVVLGVLILLFRLFYLQILQYEWHSTLSERNRINLVPVPPTRGLIFDRNGLLIAHNQPSYTLSIVREQVEDLDKTVAAVADLIEFDELARVRLTERLRRHYRPYEAVPVRFRLSETEIARIAVNQHRLPGVEVQAELVRSYPQAALTAHVVGYVGRISEQEESSIDTVAYAGTHHIGKTGLERFYEARLHGEVGYQKVETNARGKISRILDRTDPVPGEDLHLFLDMTVQAAAHQVLGQHRGSIVAIEVPTGAVVAMVSTPSFDPNLFVQGIDHETYNQLNTSEDRPLYNRAIKGQYPPGSTIKPLMALAGLAHEVVDWSFTIEDPGYYRLPGEDHQYRDWKKGGHGRVDLSKALIRSCDTYFYELSRRLGIDRIESFLGGFGLGSKTGVDFGGERLGILPSRQWKWVNRGQVWYPGETLITGIGQGFMLVTPLQLAVATARLANQGKPLVPRLWQEALGASAIKMQETNVIGSPENWSKVIAAMQAVVHSSRGTAKKMAKGISYKVAGKTGTAQVLAIKQDEEYDEKKLEKRFHDHALFVAFAPVADPLIAVAVIVENGGSGGSVASPLARAVMDAYLLQEPLAKANLETNLAIAQ